MARAGLRWSVDDLATSASVNRRTVLRFEAGEAVQPETLEALRAALAKAGAAFENGGRRVGVSVLRRD